MRVLSRGGGTVDSGSSDVEYWKFNELRDISNAEVGAYSVVKYINNYTKEIGINTITSLNGVPNVNSLVKLVGFAYTPIQVPLEGELCQTFKDYMYQMCIIYGEDISNFEELWNVYTSDVITPITKEEFYDLNNI